MVNLIKRHFQSIRRCRILAPFIILELLFFIPLLSKSVTDPPKEISFQPDEFSIGEAENAAFDNHALQLLPAENVSEEETQMIHTVEKEAVSGAYSIVVSFESGKDGDRNIKHSVGTITPVSEGNEIEAFPIDLNNGLNTAYGRLWIPVFSECNDLKLELKYNGNAPLTISGCTLRESMMYRIARLAGFLLLFAGADFLIYFLFSDGKVRLSEKWIVLGLILFAAMIPFINDTLFYGHDLMFHLKRIVAVSDGLADGQFPVRMGTRLYNGFGYPTSLYYCDLFLYPAALLYLMYVPLRTCYQVYIFLVNLATILMTHFALKSVVKNEGIVLLGCGLYTFSTYRLADVLVRASVGEFTAMCFLPLVLAGLFRIYESEKPKAGDWMPLSLGMTGVLLSHVVTTEIIGFNLVLMVFVLLRPTLKKERFLAFCKAAGLSFFLSLWFLLPFADVMRMQKTVVQAERLYMLGEDAQPWIMIFQPFAPGINNRHYKTLGLPLTLGLLLVCFCLCRWREENADRTYRKLRIVSAFSFLNLVLVSKSFPWNIIQNRLGIEGAGRFIGTIQFPWRFFAIATVLLVFGIVISLEWMRERARLYYRVASLLLSFSLVIGTGLYYYNYHNYTYSVRASMMDSYIDMDRLYLLEGTHRQVMKVSKCRVTDGDADRVEIDYRQERGDGILQIRNTSSQTVQVSVPVLDYYGNIVYDQDGNVLSHKTDKHNRISISVNSGYDGMIRIHFTEPVSWRAAEYVSLISVIGFVLWLILNRLIHFKERP